MIEYYKEKKISNMINDKDRLLMSNLKNRYIKKIMNE